MKTKKYSITKAILTVLGATTALLIAMPAHASPTGWIKGGNWASPASLYTSNYDNIMYPDGMSSSTTVAQAKTLADNIATDYKSIGLTFVRYPINPRTVWTSSSWNVTQAAINELIAQGLRVDICCFYIAWNTAHGGNGRIPAIGTWSNMWETIDGVYGNNSYVYYEPINEPFGYSSAYGSSHQTLFDYVYNVFLTQFHLKKTQGYMFLDGTGYADEVYEVGDWLVANNYNCLLAVHDYPWYATHTTDAAWSTDLYNRVQPYQGRTVMTEMGAPTTTGLNYGTANSGDNNICFIRGMCNQCLSWNAGFMYYPAHQDASLNNNKRLFVDPPGSLQVYNQSMVIELRHGWGF